MFLRKTSTSAAKGLGIFFSFARREGQDCVELLPSEEGL